MRPSLCIVGCGAYAREMLGKIQDTVEGLELYFASRERQKAKQFCDEYGGAGYFGSYDDALQDPRVDAAYLLTPHHRHLQDTLLAARHSKHILVEKPIARTTDEAKQMIAAARDAGVKLMVGENFRFLPAVQRVKEMIEAGAIGSVRLVQIQTEAYQRPGEWRTIAEFVGGGALMDSGIHYVDILLHLAGFPERVYAAKLPQVFSQMEAEDGIVITAHLPGAAVGVLTYSIGTPTKGWNHWVNVTGTTGRLSFVPDGTELVVDTPEARSTVELPEAGRGVPAMVREFRNSIMEDREPAMSGEEGLKDLAFVTAAYRSADLRQAVSLTQP